MCKKLIYLVLVLSFCLASSLQAGTIIWVDEGAANGFTGWQALLEGAGHTVTLMSDMRTLDAAKIASLNEADLVIVSRDTDSGSYDDDDEVTQWNSLTVPLIQTSSYLVRSSRWQWLAPTGTPAIGAGDNMVIVEDHFIFRGVGSAGDQLAMVTSAANLTNATETDAGNGQVLATHTDGRLWITLWEEVETPFYDGTTQVPAAPRLWFGAGLGENGADKGAMNLTDDGQAIFLNAVLYMLGETLDPGCTSDPTPANEATDVPRDVVLSWEPGEFAAPTNGHKVYFGESFDDVNDAVGGIAQTVASYTPAQRPDFGTTYYWRVDEVNAPPTSHIEFKGDVWSFTTEPIGYPIEDVNATASSSLPNMGPENTVNGSGMDADDLHSIEQTDMWVSGSEPNGPWIEFEFDKVYKLHEMFVWNSNQAIEYIVGFGAKGVTIEYSADGTSYATLGTTSEFAQAPGAPGYAHNTTIDFGGAAAKKVRLTITSNWGFLPQYSLSEVRFTYIPVLAREPQPQSGTTDMDVDVTLSWKAGREAAEHNVYIDTNEQAVMDGTADVTTVTEAGHGPLLLDLGQTYYWKVNEVNDAETPTMWEGDVWNFETQEYFVVDGFEDYNDFPGDRIYETWADGWEIPTNGARLGYLEPIDFAAGDHILETTDFHGGEQSLPFFYDNITAPSSEASVNIADLPIGSDWTGNGVKSLSLWFSGDVNNAPEQMYVKLNGVKVLYESDASNLSKAGWQPFNINLTDFTGVNLSNVTGLSIGFERIGFSGGSGMVLFDDIRLYAYERQLITPAEPNTAGLLAHLGFDDGFGTIAGDLSGNGNVGTLMGDPQPQWVAGKIGGALDFGGDGDHVLDDDGEDYINGLDALTVCMWIKSNLIDTDKGFLHCIDPAGQDRVVSMRYDSAGASFGGDDILKMGVQSTGGEQQLESSANLQTTEWQHVTMTWVSEGLIMFYVNGVEDAPTGRNGPNNGGTVSECEKLIIGKGGKDEGDSASWDGLIDDVRIYNRVLSLAEIAWLGGVIKPFDEPF